ncbi:hypothetical protein [Lichenicoccus roseus]|uniref:Uncharacterized protein n=1 Tax=Lichenicoccus roseus TaxID=2683649 RepID=A0A5R9J754_9PROT|nr:hypothetical protein [Lichenicoccus roseus]TLU71186.1 hypothetical protein FE263_18625 [Lichenicoccus roseus]
MSPPDEHLPPGPPALPARRPPWEIHPALTEDRLRACALLLAHARRDAVRLAAYDMGDDSWSVGCRAYAFGRQRLRRAAERGTYNWLTVLDESHHFVFLIEDVPVRFYRGSADEPTTRTLRRQAVEAQQLTLALGEEQAEGLVFRFALEASAAAGVERVVFLALRGEEGQVECFWPLALEAPSTDHPHREMTQLRLLDDDVQAPTLSRAPRRSSRPSHGRVAAID